MNCIARLVIAGCFVMLLCGCASWSHENQLKAADQRVKLEKTDEYLRWLCLAYKNNTGSWPTSISALESYDRTNHQALLSEIIQVHNDSSFATNQNGVLIIEKRTANGGSAKMILYP